MVVRRTTWRNGFTVMLNGKEQNSLLKNIPDGHRIVRKAMNTMRSAW
jgi:hypothetical protein